jgi:hypothetical protein
VTELIATDLSYFPVRMFEQTVTTLMTMYGGLQIYRGAASFHCEFNGEVHCCRFGLELLWVISSHKSLSLSVTWLGFLNHERSNHNGSPSPSPS